MSAQKFNLSGAEDNTQEVQQVLEDFGYCLAQAGATVRTVNTQNEHIEPFKEYIEDAEPFFPNEEQAKCIKDIEVMLDSAGLDIYGKIGLPKPRK